VSRGESGETVFYASNGDAITVDFFRRPPVATPEGRTQAVAATAALVRRSWERHMAEAKAIVVRPFQQKDLPHSRHLFSLVSRVESESREAYIIQYAVTDGSAMGTLFFTGFGNALEAAGRFDSEVEAVK